MEKLDPTKKGLYLGTGIGLILFVLVGLLTGSLVGGLIGLKLGGLIFGAPLEGALLARVFVAMSMIGGVFVSAVIFIGGMGFLGWTGGFVFDAMIKTRMGSPETHPVKER
jgi:hypothetical protein